MIGSPSVSAPFPVIMEIPRMRPQPGDWADDVYVGTYIPGESLAADKIRNPWAVQVMEDNFSSQWTANGDIMFVSAPFEMKGALHAARPHGDSSIRMSRRNDVRQFALSPDGDEAALVTDGNDRHGLVRSNVHGSSAAPVVLHNLDPQFVTYTPDGTMLIAACRGVASPRWEVGWGEPPGAGLYAIERKNNALTRLTEADDDEPCCSPDGKTIVFLREGPSGQEVCTLDLKSGVEQVIVQPLDDGHRYSSPVFSPDGARIIFTSDDGVQDGFWHPQVWVVSPHGGAPHKVDTGCCIHPDRVVPRLMELQARHNAREREGRTTGKGSS